MKHYIIILTCLFLPFFGFSQEEFSFNENNSNVYIEVISTSNLTSTSEVVSINFGSSVGLKKLKEETLKGKMFSTAIEAIAFLEKQGWALRTSNVFSNKDKVVKYNLLNKFVDISKYEK